MVGAARAMLRPVVRMLLRHGVGWKEFAELGKSVYVEVAGRDYGISGRPTNASRVSILTGLSRREVKKQRDLLAEDAGLVAPDAPGGHATRMLSGWFQDPQFSAEGRPRVLDREGESGFSALHHRYGGDIPESAMLKELVKVGAVRIRDDGRLEAVSRYYMPGRSDPEAVVRSGYVAEDLGRTLAWNLARTGDQSSRFEGRATHDAVPLGRVAAFRAFLEREAMALLEKADAWLTENGAGEDTPRRRTTRLGLGIYQIQGEEEDSGK
jgi:hypothetical protein